MYPCSQNHSNVPGVKMVHAVICQVIPWLLFHVKTNPIFTFLYIFLCHPYIILECAHVISCWEGRTLSGTLHQNAREVRIVFHTFWWRHTWWSNTCKRNYQQWVPKYTITNQNPLHMGNATGHILMGHTHGKSIPPQNYVCTICTVYKILELRRSVK